MKAAKLRDRLWLCIPPLTAMLFDTAVTVYGQAEEYWKGHHHKTNEFNPVIHAFMSTHWLGLFAITILWIAIIVPLILFLPRRLALIIASAIVLGNTWGAATWLSLHSFWHVIVLIIVNACIFALCVEKALTSQQPT
jgi:hypothetical protein